MRLLLTLLTIFLTIPPGARADMGSIPFKSGIQIREPKQDAIIAWNGKEQLIYLQTTLQASAPTRVLEVMPLPSKPAVAEAQQGIFKRCATLLPLPQSPSPSNKASDPFGAQPSAPPALVVEHKVIGAHNIKVVQLLNAEEFSSWIRKEFNPGESELEIPAKLLQSISDYARDGYRWFLFDTVDLKEAAQKKTPLQIRFATDHLYYPMRITRTETGKTTVSLSIITNVLFTAEDCIGIPREKIHVPAKPTVISANKIHFLDPPIFELLGSPRSARLRTWEISGQIDSFDKDLLIRNPVPKN